ncbi:type VI secretion system baseplate subunit TssF [Salmonella enterica]|nr:type VI secretion system baseplate subunit TssF [Salmonella enterica]EMD7797659.1 type VI secretion system baseplate subunit TssF [Salmonella enterica]
MGDDFLRYFDSEMRYLREAALEFAGEHPDRARALGIDAFPGPRDESVERLFQGFAFMMARLRHKLDDDLPELTTSPLSQLLPVVNHPLPSMAVVELAPERRESFTRDEVIEAHTELLSLPVEYPAGGAQRCLYRTSRDMRLSPLFLDDLSVSTRTDGNQTLGFTLALYSGAEVEHIDWRQLSFYLGGTRQLQSELYLALTRRVQSIRVRLSGETEGEWLSLSGGFTPVWRQAEPDGEFPWPDSDSPAPCGEIRPLLAYFSVPEHYYFLSFNGLDALALTPDCRSVHVQIILSGKLSPACLITPDALLLHCVPVINLFRVMGEPIKINPAEREYVVRPYQQGGERLEVYRIDEVSQRAGDKVATYTPYCQFSHRGEILNDRLPERFYDTRLHRGPAGGHETVLTLGGSQHTQEETRLHLNLTCTNGFLPRQSLQRAIFDSAYSLNGVSLRGQTRALPGLPCYPPESVRYPWHLMSLLHPQTFNHLLTAQALRHVLVLLDWTDSKDNAERIAGVMDVTPERITTLAHGQFHRGISVHLTLDETRFSGIGDAWLFSEVVERFYAQYADNRCVVQLDVTLHPSQTHWRWPVNCVDDVLL